MHQGGAFRELVSLMQAPLPPRRLSKTAKMIALILWFLFRSLSI